MTSRRKRSARHRPFPPLRPRHPPTLATAIHDFLTSYLPQHRGASAHTVISYARALRTLREFLGGKGKGRHTPSFADLTAENILAYLAELETGRGNSPATRNVRLAAIRSFLRYGFLMGSLQKSQLERIGHVAFKRFPPSSPTALEPEELEAILRSVDYSTRDGFRDLAILKFMYNTGARASEVASIRISDLDLDALHVAITGKGGRRRLASLWQTTAALLRIYLATERRVPGRGFEDRLFIGQRRQGLTRSGIHFLVRRYVLIAAASCPSLRRKTVTPHTLRHTTGVHLVEAGVDLNTIREWLGHAHIATTELYARPNLRTKRRALARLEELDRRLCEEIAARRAAVPIGPGTRRWLESLEK